MRVKGIGKSYDINYWELEGYISLVFFNLYCCVLFFCISYSKWQTYFELTISLLIGYRDGSEDGLTFAFRFTDAAVSIPNQGK